MLERNEAEVELEEERAPLEQGNRERQLGSLTDYCVEVSSSLHCVRRFPQPAVGFSSKRHYNLECSRFYRAQVLLTLQSGACRAASHTSVSSCRPSY